ncbi:MAG: capsid protein VP2 [Archaeoglobus sp.]|uniref:capsid protein VP2 n=1 Tax=Archaeoglobus sp. TaxID=1872626 RepID=UPI001D4FF363|nr:capsid protein VP2 [Archaeoglobus sp.]MBO8180486.1 capsid protein VP2 [Archaeoglobus sp.]
MARKKWIQEAIERPGRVRRYVKRLFGNKAFTKEGKIKLSYLRKAKKRAERTGNTSLVKAINLAITLRGFRKKKKKKKGGRKK